MSPLPETGHEHHERIREHIDRLPELADMLEQRPVPEEFGPRFAAECDFMTGTLLPHIEVVEQSVYPELERLQQNKHSMAPLRREHDEMREIVAQMKTFKGRVEAGELKPTMALEMRRMCIRFYALVKTHIGEEQEYLRVLQGNLSEGEQATVEAALGHVAAE